MSGPAIPPGAVSGQAVMAVRQHLIDHGCTIPVDVVREALEAAEAVWPHGPPGRDPASTTAASAVIRSQPDFYRRKDRRPLRPAPFGFGKDVTA